METIQEETSDDLRSDSERSESRGSPVGWLATDSESGSVIRINAIGSLINSYFYHVYYNLFLPTWISLVTFCVSIFFATIKYVSGDRERNDLKIKRNIYEICCCCCFDIVFTCKFINWNSIIVLIRLLNFLACARAVLKNMICELSTSKCNKFWFFGYYFSDRSGNIWKFANVFRKVPQNLVTSQICC